MDGQTDTVPLARRLLLEAASRINVTRGHCLHVGPRLDVVVFFSQRLIGLSNCLPASTEHFKTLSSFYYFLIKVNLSTY